MTSDNNSEVMDLNAKLQKAELRSKEAEEKMFQAAEFGKQLLEQKQNLEQNLEQANQEKHELRLKLNLKNAEERSWKEEIQHLKKILAQQSKAHEENLNVEREMENTREELEDSRRRERRLEDRVQLLEIQIEEALNSTIAQHNQSLKSENNKSFGESEMIIQQLQSEQVEWIKEKQSMQIEILEWKGKYEEVSDERNQLDIELRQKLEEKECEVVSYCQKMEELREEMQEYQVEIDQLKIGQVDPRTKGNSLFSEVEDRRTLVESQMASLKAKYENMKVQLELKNQQLKKVKLNNVTLLNMANRSNDGDRVKRLEELLLSEKKKTQLLSERITLLEKEASMSSIDSYLKRDSDDQQRLKTANKEASSCSLKGPRDNAGLLERLRDEKNKNAELQKQLQIQTLQSFSDGEKMMELSRKMKVLETNLSRAKAENYHLKVKLDEKKDLQWNSNEKVSRKNESKTIFEDIKFGKETDNKENDKPKRHVLESNDDVSSCGNKVSSSNLDVGSKKKTVSISDTVLCVEQDGGKKKSPLNTNEEKIKIKRDPKTTFIPVIDAEVEEEKWKQECAQQ